MASKRPDPSPPKPDEADEGLPRQSEPTMFAQLPDPGIAKLHGELSNENLEGMQKILLRCEPTHITPGLQGFNYHGFVQNLQGISKVEFGAVRLYALVTRNNAFILANVIAEKLHDLVQGLMDLQLSERITLKDGGKIRYLYKVPSQQMERLRSIANHDRLISANIFPFNDLAQFKQKLALCTVQAGATLDIKTFAAGVQSVSSLYEDRSGSWHHRLAHSDGTEYLLFILPKTPIASSVALSLGPVRLALGRA
jgi:hypothetical protein